MKQILLLSLLLLLTACGGVAGRIETAKQQAADKHYRFETLQVSPFPLQMAAPLAQGNKPQDIITIVIEGDGYAFVSRSQVSGDPTPKNPVGLQIATAHPDQPVYLARPCQYIRTDKCRPYYWTVGRFDEEIISSYNKALDNIIADYGHKNTKIRAIGYSGGAYIALTLAAQRADIAEVVTVAGLLSPEDWTAHFNLTPLQTPLTAPQIFQKTQNIPMTHYCGGQDKVIPCGLSRAILDKYAPYTANQKLITLPQATHSKAGQDYLYAL